MAGLNSKDAVKKDVNFSPFDWLSLKISQKTDPDKRPKALVFISVPKKIVALATRRNRLKRLIRETVRQDNFFKDPSKVFSFRVMRMPDMKTLGLQAVKETVVSLCTSLLITTITITTMEITEIRFR